MSSKNIYNDKAYGSAKSNTKYNQDGRAVISKDDEWVEEKEWDELLEEMRLANDYIPNKNTMKTTKE